MCQTVGAGWRNAWATVRHDRPLPQQTTSLASRDTRACCVIYDQPLDRRYRCGLMRKRPIGSHRLPKTKPTVHTFFAVRFATLLRSLEMLTKWVTSVHERFAGLGHRFVQPRKKPKLEPFLPIIHEILALDVRISQFSIIGATDRDVFQSCCIHVDHRLAVVPSFVASIFRPRGLTRPIFRILTWQRQSVATSPHNWRCNLCRACSGNDVLRINRTASAFLSHGAVCRIFPRVLQSHANGPG